MKLNNNLEKEIRSLKEENLRLKNNYDNLKIALNNTKNQNENILYSQLEELKKENDLIIKRNNEDLKKILEEKDKQIRTYEKSFEEMKNKKEDYELNNILLQRQFNELKKSKTNELIERENKMKEKSIKEKDKIIEEYTKKFSDFDNEKKKYYEKYSKMSEEFQKLTKEISDERLKLEEEDDKLRRENIQLQKDNENMQKLISKHNVELNKKNEIINILKSNLDDINLKMKSHFDNSNNSINQLSILFNKDKIEWQKERQDLLNQIDSLNLLLNDLKNQNEKLEKEKSDFRNNCKKYISSVIDEKMSQLDSN